MGHLNLIEWENAPWFRSSLTTNSSQVRIGEVWLRTFPRRSNEIPVFKDLTHFNNSEYCPRLFRDIVWTRLLLRRDRKFGLTGKLHSFLISDYCVIKIETGFLNLHVKYIYIYIKALYVEIWLDMRLCKILLSVCKTWKKNPENRKKSITKFIQFPCLIFDISGHSIWNFCFSKYDWYSRWKSKLFKSRIILGKYVFLLIF